MMLMIIIVDCGADISGVGTCKRKQRCAFGTERGQSGRPNVLKYQNTKQDTKYHDPQVGRGSSFDRPIEETIDDEFHVGSEVSKSECDQGVSVIGSLKASLKAIVAYCTVSNAKQHRYNFIISTSQEKNCEQVQRTVAWDLNDHFLDEGMRYSYTVHFEREYR